jgi:hypothetical protein
MPLNSPRAPLRHVRGELEDLIYPSMALPSSHLARRQKHTFAQTGMTTLQSFVALVYQARITVFVLMKVVASAASQLFLST